MKLATFDIFDTVLTRRVCDPHAVFQRAASLVGVAPAEYRRLRVDAETRVRRDAPGNEPTFTEIFAALADTSPFTAAELDRLMAAELAAEAEMIVLAPGAVELIAERRAAGERIVFASDMYLPSAFLREQLQRCGLYEEGDACYVSCEHRVSKSTGQLFERIIADLGADRDACIHFGNDHRADVLGAQKARIRSVHRTDGNPTRYERILESWSDRTNGLSSLLAGASRLARMSVPVANERERIIRDVAAGVGGPMLTAFVAWTLKQSQQDGVAKLHFVSRDGEILLAIAKELADAIPGPEVGYMYGGRHVWHLASFDGIDEHSTEWILCEHRNPALGDVLARLELPAAEATELLRTCHLRETTCLLTLSSNQRHRLLESLKAADAGRRVAATTAQLLGAYSRQLGVAEAGADERHAIVDVGWTGRSFSSLNRAAAKLGIRELSAYFIGLKPYASSLNGSYSAFAKEPFLASLIEVLCSASHGRVVGFEGSASGNAIPVLASPTNEAVVAWGQPLMARVITTYSRAAKSFPELCSLTADQWQLLLPAIRDCMEAFWSLPTPAEAAVWGGFPYEEDQVGRISVPLAQGYLWRDVISAMRGRWDDVQRQRVWNSGSWSLTRRPLSTVLGRTLRHFPS